MDRETVITRLQVIHTWAEFAREYDLQFFTAKHLEDIAQWADDALELLKSQPQIVRCKDCEMNNQCSIQFKFANADNPGDWFCAYGEVKDNG